MYKNPAKIVQLLRLLLIGLMVFFAAGGISLFFLVQLGASVFEIDLIFTWLPAGLAYLVFSIMVFIPYMVFKTQDPMIAFYPFSKKEEFIQLIVESIGAATGLMLIIIGQFSANERMLLSSIGFICLFLPGLIWRFIVIIKKAYKNTKHVAVVTTLFILFIVVPSAISLGGVFQENYGLGYFDLLYVIPLIILLSVGHKEDDLEASSETLEQEQANQTNI